MSWLNYFSNHQIHYIKKTMFELMQERYSKNEQIIERVGASLTTEKDIKDFLELITDLYEMAYLRAVKDQREQLEKLGLVANIKPSNAHSK